MVLISTIEAKKKTNEMTKSDLTRLTSLTFVRISVTNTTPLWEFNSVEIPRMQTSIVSFPEVSAVIYDDMSYGNWETILSNLTQSVMIYQGAGIVLEKHVWVRLITTLIPHHIVRKLRSRFIRFQMQWCHTILCCGKICCQSWDAIFYSECQHRDCVSWVTF